MRGYVHVYVAVIVTLGWGESLRAEALLACDRPVETDPAAIETSVHPIWQIDPDRLNLGYIPDSYSAVADVSAGFDVLESRDTPVIPDSNMGVRLDNGWSLGFTYELLDARFKVGPFLLPEPGEPVFEGPKFVATLKFR